MCNEMQLTLPLFLDTELRNPFSKLDWSDSDTFVGDINI